MFSFFWKGKDLIFSNIYCKDGKFYIFNSWNGVTEPLEETSFVSKSNILTKAQCSFDEIGRKELLKNKKVDSKSANFSFLESYFKGEQFYSFKKNNSKKLKFLERKNKKINDDLKKIGNLDNLEIDLKKLKITLDDRDEFLLGGKKIKFEKDWNPFKKRDFLFSKLKKLKKGIEILNKRKNDCDLDIKKLKHKEKDYGIDIIKIKVIRPFWNFTKKQASKKHLGKKQHYDEYTLDNKYRLGLGLNSQGNDNLRKSYGKKNDFWFHIENYKSCHCIVKVENISDINDKYFDSIGSIIRDKSKLDIEIIPFWCLLR